MRNIQDIARLGLPAALAAMALCAHAQPGEAPFPSFPQPSQEAVVKAQGAHAMAQLRILSAVMGSDPSGAASREAIEKGWAPVDRGFASPTHGWPARGPSLGEAIEPLLAQARAAAEGCRELEGACQKDAASWAKSASREVKRAKNPGAELRRRVESLG